MGNAEFLFGSHRNCVLAMCCIMFAVITKTKENPDTSGR